MAKKQKDVTLQQIAEEMNDIMAYGKDPETGDVDESELLDVEMSEGPLQKEILKRANEDLRAADEEDFSPEVWKWFIDNGISPAGADLDGDDEPVEETKPAAKSKAPAKTSKDADTGEKKGIKKAMVPGGNEAKAIEIVKEVGVEKGLDACIKEFTKIYAAAGNDKEYALKRAKIYFGIACKALGKKNPHVSESRGNPEALAKAREARAANKEKAAEKEAPKGKANRK